MAVGLCDRCHRRIRRTTGRSRRPLPSRTPPLVSSAGSPPAAPPSPENGVLWIGTSALIVLNAYPYSSGHLMAVPLRHVGSLGDLTEGEATELWSAARLGVAALEVGIRTRGRQPRSQPGRGGRSRHPPTSPPPRRSPLAGRHQLHDRGGRHPGAPRDAGLELGAPHRGLARHRHSRPTDRDEPDGPPLVGDGSITLSRVLVVTDTLGTGTRGGRYGSQGARASGALCG